MKAVAEIIQAHIPNLQTLDMPGNRIMELANLAILCGKIPLQRLNLMDNRIGRTAELEKIKGFPLLQDLNVTKNPLRDTFRDNPSFVEAVRRELPQLMRLDGVDLPRKIGFDAPPRTQLPLPVPVYVPQGELAKQQLQKFVIEFFNCFDSQRSSLLGEYAEDAKFSFFISRQQDR